MCRYSYDTESTLLTDIFQDKSSFTSAQSDNMDSNTLFYTSSYNKINNREDRVDMDDLDSKYRKAIKQLSLSSIPSTIQYRDEEKKTVYNFLFNSIKNGQFGSALYISGNSNLIIRSSKLWKDIVC